MYVVIAYRWDCLNLHNYLVGATAELDWAIGVAQAERDDRGGKYGVAVWEAPAYKHDVRDHKLAHYVPSLLNHEKPYKSFRQTALEMIGARVLSMYERGEFPNEEIVKACENMKSLLELDNVD